MSPSREASPEALYHPIPQAPVATNPLLSDLDPEDDIPTHPPDVLDPWAQRIQFLLGCAVLLPWNEMITATPYFLSRLANSPLRPAFSSYLSTSFTAANFAFLAHATVTSKQTSPSRRIVNSLLWLSGLTLLLTLSTLVQISPGLFFVFCLAIGIGQAALGSYLQTSVIAIASLFGPSAMQTIMSGQAAVAVVVSAVQVTSAAISTWGQSSASINVEQEPEERSAFIFFALSTIFLLFTALAQRRLTTMPSYQAAIRHLEVKQEIDPEESRGLMSSGRQNDLDRDQILRVAKANWLYEFAAAFVFVVTLAVFPPITTSVRPTNPSTHPLLFTSIHFLVFACGDLLGRYLCSVPRLLVWSARRLTTLALARIGFIPLFLMCNVQRGSLSQRSPIINSDWIFMFILLLFGTSNGYVSSMCMMAAPSLEHNPRLRGRRDDVDIAATVASFSIVGGLAIGSIASFVVRGTICSCNPFIE